MYCSQTLKCVSCFAIYASGTKQLFYASGIKTGIKQLLQNLYLDIGVWGDQTQAASQDVWAFKLNHVSSLNSLGKNEEAWCKCNRLCLMNSHKTLWIFASPEFQCMPQRVIGPDSIVRYNINWDQPIYSITIRIELSQTKDLNTHMQLKHSWTGPSHQDWR